MEKNKETLIEVGDLKKEKQEVRSLIFEVVRLSDL